MSKFFHDKLSYSYFNTVKWEKLELQECNDEYNQIDTDEIKVDSTRGLGQ